MGHKSVGLVAMICSAFLFSVMALLVKLLSAFTTSELVFWRSAFMTVLSTCLCIQKKMHPLGPRTLRATGLLIVRGLCGFVFMGAYYHAIRMLPLSDAVVISYTSPVITAVAAVVFLREPMGLLDVAGSVMCLSGVVLVSKPSFVMEFFGADPQPLPVAGVLAALGAALGSTAVYILLRFAKDIDPTVSTNYFALVGLVVAPSMARMCGESWTLEHTGYDWLLVVMVSVLSVIGQNLMNFALSVEKAGKAVAMNYTQVVFSYIYQVTLLHEPSDQLSVLGSLLIISWGVISFLKESAIEKSAQAREPFLQTCVEG